MEVMDVEGKRGVKARLWLPASVSICADASYRDVILAIKCWKGFALSVYVRYSRMYLFP